MSNLNFTIATSAIQYKNGIALVLTKRHTTVGAVFVPYNTANTKPLLKDFDIPALGEQGMPIEITGPFDGNYTTTACKIGDMPVQVIAESIRKAIFSGGTAKGLTSITLKERNVEKKSVYRVVGLHLNVSKTTLLKGERAEVVMQMEGLKNLENKIYLLIEAQGNVAMKKGNRQYIEIRPSDVRADGTSTQTRTITGLQKGAFQITVSVEGNLPSMVQ